MPPRGRIELDEQYYKGCGLCVAVCPGQLMELAAERLSARAARADFSTRVDRVPGFITQA